MYGTLVIISLLLHINQLLYYGLALTITTGHCFKNVTTKYQVPVSKTRLSLDTNKMEYYVEMEDRLRVDTVRMCCPGYRTIIFGLCEPICSSKCPPHSYCSEPEKCQCMRGYEESHNHHVRSITPNASQHLECRPICSGGCLTPHTHCVGHNHCACRPGYKDISSWFAPVQCERIQCPGDQLYDVHQRKCVRVELDLEQLMQKVGRKLAKGLNDLQYDDDEDDDISVSFKGD
ncbi:nimrod C3 [Haematobia irritans]|uniref:nimrod C3 n=1 Tax=Haematobia irritans TaxID=7368 RepID=UPI003F509CE6